MCLRCVRGSCAVRAGFVDVELRGMFVVGYFPRSLPHPLSRFFFGGEEVNVNMLTDLHALSVSTMNAIDPKDAGGEEQ